MNYEDFLEILKPLGFLTLGAFFTAVRGKMNSMKQKNFFHWFFLFLGIATILFAVLIAFYYHGELLNTKANETSHKSGLWILILSVISGSSLLWFTLRYKTGKLQYKTKELDGVVNKFTEHADNKNIRLLAGDLNFFGNSPEDMEENKQYVALRKGKFRQIEIICFKPKDNQEKMRYGKLLSEMPIKLKFYYPQKADLNVRGRMKTLGSVTHLLIYNKVSSGVYEALELDTSNSSGALYNHIWDLIWQLAEEPTADELSSYKTLYNS